jgi:hypothetical protein
MLKLCMWLRCKSCIVCTNHIMVPQKKRCCAGGCSSTVADRFKISQVSKESGACNISGPIRD